jgi:hypothetical protein
VIPIRDKTLPTVVACIDQSLRRFGGCPTYGLSDNEKTLTVEHMARIAIRNPDMVAAAHHYGLTVVSCLPANPGEQGRVGTRGWPHFRPERRARRHHVAVLRFIMARAPSSAGTARAESSPSSCPVVIARSQAWVASSARYSARRGLMMVSSRATPQTRSAWRDDQSRARAPPQGAVHGCRDGQRRFPRLPRFL